MFCVGQEQPFVRVQNRSVVAGRDEGRRAAGALCFIVSMLDNLLLGSRATWWMAARPGATSACCASLLLQPNLDSNDGRGASKMIVMAGRRHRKQVVTPASLVLRARRALSDADGRYTSFPWSPIRVNAIRLALRAVCAVAVCIALFAALVPSASAEVARPSLSPRSLSVSSTNTVSIDPGVVSTLAGSGSFANVDGTGGAAAFALPVGVAMVGSSLYVLDVNAIRVVDPSTGAVSTLAGPGGACHYGDSSIAAQVSFCDPTGLTTDGSFLYFVDESNIRRTDLSTGATTTVVSGNSTVGSYVGVTEGADGYLYATTSSGNLVQVDPGSDTATVVASGLSSLGALTSSSSALFVRSGSAVLQFSYSGFTYSTFVADTGDVNPAGAITAAGGYLYLAGDNGNSVRRYDTASGALVIVAGDPTAGFQNGTGYNAWFNQVAGLVSNGSNAVYVADSGNNQVRAMAGGAAPLAVGGPILPAETSGGHNPSENGQCQPCSGDPVDVATGEFAQTVTDLAVPGRGVGLALSRTYGSLESSHLGMFGYGWASSYQMSIAANPYFGSSVMDVHQENGSVVEFQQTSSGGWAAASRVLASLVHNADGSWTFVRRGRQVFVFNSSGQLSSISDLNGDAVTLGYNSSGQLATVTDGAGRTLSFSYGSNGLVSEVTGPAGRTVSYSYDSADELTSVTDPAGGVTGYAYSGDHLLASITNANGGVTSNSYDSSRRVVAQVDPMGRTTTWSYSTDAAGSGSVAVTHPGGNVTYYLFSAGEMTSKTDAYGTALAATWSYTYDPATLGVTSVTNPDGSVSSYTYDASGNRTSAIDPLGRTTTWTYNALDEPTSTTSPTGVTTTNTYDSAANLLSTSMPLPGGGQAATSYTYGDPSHPADVTAMTNPDGHTWTYVYDAQGDRVSVTDPAGDETSYTYNVLGERTSTVSARGNVAGANPAQFTTTYTYDALGRLVETVDPLGGVTKSVYDALGNLVSATNPLGDTTISVYNADSELTKVTAADGSATSYAYDVNGNKVSVTNPLGEVTAYGYDALNRRISATDPLGAKTTYAYDPAGNLTSSTDPLGQVTAYSYDKANEQTRVVHADGTTVSYTYDSLGKKSSYTDASGGTWSYGYDSLGRLVSVTDPDSHTTGYAYDAAGNKVSMTDAQGRVTTYTYDAAGRLSDVSYSAAGTASVSYTYNANGQKASMVDGTGTTTYVYDAAGRVTSSTNGAGATVSYSYDSAGEVTGVTYPNGKAVARSYNNVGELSSVTDWLGNTTKFSYDAAGDLTSTVYPGGSTGARSYDAAGRLSNLSYVNSSGAAIAGFGVTRDGLGQVTASAATGAVSPAGQSYSYSSLNQLAADSSGAYGYDPAGNLVSLPGGKTQAFDPAGQLCWSASTATSTCGAVPSGATEYGYSPEGNRTSATPASGAAVAYGWNQANQLVSYTSGGTSVAYTYDGAGLRASATTGGASTQFTWDTVASVPLLLSDGTNFYVYGPGGTPIEQISSSASATFLLQGPSGSTRMIMSNTGAVLATFTYDSYGSLTASTGTATTPLLWQGQYLDTTSGLYYLRARYYDPTTGQFLTVDPLVTTTNAPYTYAGDNPVNGSDPSGLCVSLFGVACVGSGPQTSAIYFRFDPGAGANAAVNIGRGASFGLSDKIANWIQPGASCTVAQNSIDNSIGHAASSPVAAEGAGRLLAAGVARLGDAAYQSKLFGPDSRLFGNSSLGRTGQSGLLNPPGRGTWRLGWSVDGQASPAVPGFRLKAPGIGYWWIMHGSGF